MRHERSISMKGIFRCYMDRHSLEDLIGTIYCDVLLNSILKKLEISEQTHQNKRILF